MDDRDVIILGGGLAGIAAAVRLIQHGVRPTLVERRPFLGGRAFSFVDRASGEEIDNGQHVILGVCHEFLQLLNDLGTRDEIELGSILDVPVSLNGQVANLRAHRILGNAYALLRYGHLSFADQIAVAGLLLRIKFNLIGDVGSNPATEASFADWLASRGQSRAAIDRFWSLFVLPVFNCHVDEVAATDVVEFTRLALLGSTQDAAIGYPSKGLSTLIGSPAAEYLDSHGADMKMNTRVTSLAMLESGSFEVSLSTGEVVHSKSVISALAPDALARVLSASGDCFVPIASAMTEFEYSPIVAVHLWYQNPVMTEQVMAFLDLGLQWVFNDSALRGVSDKDTQHIVISLSGADDWADLSKAEVLDRVTSAMREAFPEARGNPIVNSAVVKTLEATIKVTPRSVQHRIGPTIDVLGDVPGFYIAGDWSNTRLPATMEGAVRSGNSAAELAFQRCCDPVGL